MTVTDYPDYQTPQAHASAISVTGAPLINLANLINTNTITANTTVPQGPFTVSQIAYELAINAQMATVIAGTTVLDITLTWSDSTTGLQLNQKSYQIVCDPNGTPHQVRITGPAHGDTLNLSFHNNGGSATGALITYTLLGSSRIYGRDVCRTTVFAQQGFTSGAPLVPYGVLAQTSFNVGAGATVTRLMGMYSGRAWLVANTASGLADAVIQVLEAATAVPLMNNDPTFYRNRTNAAGDLNDWVPLPSIQALLSLTNNNAASQIINAAIMIDESGE